jgi:ubiquinone/menaquinone biosynthesis C-methylase UbiE
MDVFGFNTQGVNYDKFRPRYPSSFIQKCLSSIKHRNKYLDIATGTGQLLFAFAPHFQYSKGIDISKNMIESAAKAK